MQAIQTRFDGGELSERLRGRFDSEIYKKALAYCYNFAPTPQGSLLMRAGTDHVRVLTGDARTRLLPVRVVSGQDYLIELIDHAMRLYAIDGKSAIDETVYASELVANGDFADALTGWTVKSEANASVTIFDREGNNTLQFERYFNAATAWARQTLTLTSTANLQVEMNCLALVEWAQVRVKLGSTPGGAQLLSWQGPASGTVSLFVEGVTPGTYYLSIESPEADAEGYDANNAIFEVDDVSVEAQYPQPISDLATPWSADEVRDVQYAAETGRDRIIFVHPNHPPYYLARNAIGSWDFGEVGTGTVVFTNKPEEWTGTKWPGVIAIHDGRAWWSGHPTEKNRVWASKSGTLFDFTTGSGSGGEELPGDRIDLKIATTGAVRWIKSGRALLVGTDLGEFSISGSKGTPLNGDIHVRQESAFGSCDRVQPVDAGNLALYLSGDRRKVRAASFSQEGGGWGSKDVTFTAEHLTEGGVKEIHFAFTPDPQLFAVLESGTLRGCVFAPEEGVVAWWRLQLASGAVRSAAVSRGASGAFLWVAVERLGAMYLERLPLGDGTDLSYLDGRVEGTVDSLGRAHGFAHFWSPPAFVFEDGIGPVPSIEIGSDSVEVGKEYAGKRFSAGVRFNARAITLPKDVRGGKARNVKIGVILNDSALPQLNGRRPPERRPADAMDRIAPRITGKREVLGVGFDDEGKIEILQDLPLRTEILALFETTQASEV